uniref:hypothetical protein n=1 Tax=Adlercreutzia murintestinalis TaxID=2941325 RepID=UPI00203BED1C
MVDTPSDLFAYLDDIRKSRGLGLKKCVWGNYSHDPRTSLLRSIRSYEALGLGLKKCVWGNYSHDPRTSLLRSIR